MKKLIKIIHFSLLVISSLNELVGQTIPASKLIFGEINETSLSINWKNEQKTKHIIIAKKDGQVTSKPIDGVDYFVSNIFGLGNELGDNEFIVYEGDNDKMNLVGLKPNTAYHFVMFEYKGASYSVEYNKTKILVGKAITKKASVESLSKLTNQNFEKSMNKLETVEAEKLGLKILGNPVQDILSFEFASNNDALFDIKLFDVLGKVYILQKCNTNTKTELDMKQLPSGTYILVVNKENKIFTRKIFKIN